MTWHSPPTYSSVPLCACSCSRQKKCEPCVTVCVWWAQALLSKRASSSIWTRLKYQTRGDTSILTFTITSAAFCFQQSSNLKGQVSLCRIWCLRTQHINRVLQTPDHKCSSPQRHSLVLLFSDTFRTFRGITKQSLEPKRATFLKSSSADFTAFSQDEGKILKRGENHHKSSHVETWRES